MGPQKIRKLFFNTYPYYAGKIQKAFLSLSLSICLSVCPSVLLSVNRSVSMSIGLSVCLSVSYVSIKSLNLLYSIALFFRHPLLAYRTITIAWNSLTYMTSNCYSNSQQSWKSQEKPLIKLCFQRELKDAQRLSSSPKQKQFMNTNSVTPVFWFL